MEHIFTDDQLKKLKSKNLYWEEVSRRDNAADIYRDELQTLGSVKPWQWIGLIQFYLKHNKDKI